MKPSGPPAREITNARRRAVSVFAVLMGALLLGTWVVLFLLGAVEEGSSRIELVFLLVAEALTGITLVGSGVATTRGRPWGAPCLLVALGMLLYCTVYSIGVFAGKGNAPATAWFILVSAADVLGGALLVTDVSKRMRASVPAEREKSATGI